MFPSLSSAIVVFWHASTFTILVNPETSTAKFELSFVPFPNCPAPFNPQVYTFPSIDNATLWLFPEDICLIFFKLSAEFVHFTETGSFLFTLSPEPKLS